MAKKTQANNETLSVVGPIETEDRGMLQRQLVRAQVDVKELRERIHAFLHAMESALGDISQQFGDYKLDTISVSAEVSAKGQISLLGTGGELAGKGGLNFTFKRGV